MLLRDAVEHVLSELGDALSRGLALRGETIERVRVVSSQVVATVRLPDGERVRLRFARGEGTRGFMSVGAWRVSHEGAGDAGEAWGRAQKEAMTAERAVAIAEGLARAIEGLPEIPAHDLGEPLKRENAVRLIGPEGALVAPLAEHYARHYGEPIRVTARGSLRFPSVAGDQSLFMRAPPAFTEDVRFRAYLADLGYGVDDEGFVRIAPTPERFARAREALGLAAGGFRPRLFRARVAVLSARAWLREIARGVLPINLYGEAVYRLTAPARVAGARVVPALRTMWNTHFHALGHDMTLHAFAMHRVPADEIARLRARARRAARRPGIASEAAFFEGTLTRRCVGLWTGLEHPDDFADAYRASLGVVG